MKLSRFTFSLVLTGILLLLAGEKTAEMASPYCIANPNDPACIAIATPGGTPPSPDPSGGTPAKPAVQLHYVSRGIDLGEGEFDINPTPFKSLRDFTAGRFVPLLTGIVVLLTILVFMIGSGFWMFSAGNESMVERGKNMMVYSGLGLLLVLGAYVLVQLYQIILYALGT